MEQSFRSTAGTGMDGAITAVAVGTAATTMAGTEATTMVGNVIAIGDDFHL
jgi:hypothetical protein